MKQYPISFQNTEELRQALRQFSTEHDMSRCVFQIFSATLDQTVIEDVCRAVREEAPDVPYFGCSTSGNLQDCEVAPEILLTALEFERESTRCKVLQYNVKQSDVREVTEDIARQTRENAWIKALEFYFTIPDGSYTAFCNGLRGVREDIKMFGGVSCSNDITSSDCLVFSSAGACSSGDIVVVMYGGEDFHADAIKITGWKPLGRKFTVTKSEGSLLQELDGIPAYEVYHKYLNIPNDENFFYNALEFPLFYEHDGTTILRVPTQSNPDLSLTMSSDIEVGSTVRISYGDPKTIVDSIAADSGYIQAFSPDILHIFSCAARKTFWAMNESTYELEPFRDIAPSTGFFSHGEFLRAKGCLNQHNVTLIVAAMREGEVTKPHHALHEATALSRIPLVSRLATFISVTSLELEEMNERLETANRNLRKAAITDGLTGLYNRAEMQRRIDVLLGAGGKLSLVMLDIDNFKQVNDTYGHQEGDAVIVALAGILRNEQTKSYSRFSAGRWGGEEFMLALADTDVSAASLIAELTRQCFANTSYPSARAQTVSVGVTQMKEGDTADSLCMRVDQALYKAKREGKNKVVIL